MDQEQSYEEALENPYQPVDNPGINGLVILLALQSQFCVYRQTERKKETYLHVGLLYVSNN